MSRALVLIGHHLEESEFGKQVRQRMEDDDILFYEIKNSYSNKLPIPSQERNIVEEEIMSVMKGLGPTITMDIHTGKGAKRWDGIELFTYWETETLKNLNGLVTTDIANHPGKIFLTGRYQGAHDAPRMMQREFPYITLEYFLQPEAKTPFRYEVELTRKTILDIDKLYRKIDKR